MRPTDTDVVIRADRIAAPPGVLPEVRGASAVAGQSLIYSRRTRIGQLALVDGADGIVLAPRGRVTIVLTFKVTGKTISEIDVIADPARLSLLDLVILEGRLSIFDPSVCNMLRRLHNTPNFC